MRSRATASLRRRSHPRIVRWRLRLPGRGVAGCAADRVWRRRLLRCRWQVRCASRCRACWLRLDWRGVLPTALLFRCRQCLFRPGGGPEPFQLSFALPGCSFQPFFALFDGILDQLRACVGGAFYAGCARVGGALDGLLALGRFLLEFFADLRDDGPVGVAAGGELLAFRQSLLGPFLRFLCGGERHAGLRGRGAVLCSFVTCALMIGFGSSCGP